MCGSYLRFSLWTVTKLLRSALPIAGRRDGDLETTFAGRYCSLGAGVRALVALVLGALVVAFFLAVGGQVFFLAVDTASGLLVEGRCRWGRDGRSTVGVSQRFHRMVWHLSYSIAHPIPIVLHVVSFCGPHYGPL